MSRLPSLSYLNVATKLKRAGFLYVRTGKHDVYVNCEKNITAPLPRHSGDMPKGTLRTL